MGLKSGSREAGLDESNDTDDQQDTGASPREGDAEREADTATPAQESGSDGKSSTSGPATGDDSRPSMDAIPYKLRREKVNAGREQVPFFLRSEVIADEEELQTTLEETLGETVYKSDYREAAMVLAQRNPDLVAEILREWGYDLQ